MLKLIPFDIFRPKLLLAISVRVVPSVSFLLRMCTLRICSRPFTSGRPTVTRRSNRPGRSRALSKMSERLVAATTMTPLLPSKPSISVRILSMIQEYPGIQERSLEDLRTFSRQSLQNRIGKAGNKYCNVAAKYLPTFEISCCAFPSAAVVASYVASKAVEDSKKWF